MLAGRELLGGMARKWMLDFQERGGISAWGPEGQLLADCVCPGHCGGLDFRVGAWVGGLTGKWESVVEGGYYEILVSKAWFPPCGVSGMWWDL